MLEIFFEGSTMLHTA